MATQDVVRGLGLRQRGVSGHCEACGRQHDAPIWRSVWYQDVYRALVALAKDGTVERDRLDGRSSVFWSARASDGVDLSALVASLEDPS